MDIRIVDTISRGSFHEVFNAALLSICREGFERVEYICHVSQRDCILGVLERNGRGADTKGVTFRATPVVRREGPVGWVCKYLLGAVLNVWYLATTPRGVQVVYTYNNPLALWPVNVLNKLLGRRVIVVCHGELELLRQRPAWYKAQGVFRAIMKRMFGRGRIEDKIRFCVLGRSILRNLQPWLAEQNRGKFFAMDHAYFFGETAPRPVHDHLCVGSVGQLTPGKGLHTLLALSRTISVPLAVVGRTYGFEQWADYPNVHFAAGVENAPIPRERYDAEIARLDYILYAYDPDGYKLTASGAVFDALNAGRPVITLRNDYFDEVLRLSVGYVVSDAGQMAGVIDRLAVQYPENPEYGRFLENIDRLREYYRIEAVAERFCETYAGLYRKPEKPEK